MGKGRKRGAAAIALGLALLVARPAVPATSSLSSLGGLASGNDTAYQNAAAAITDSNYPSALAYLTESIAAYPDNGEAYLARAKVDLVLDVPSQAVSDASQGLALLRASDTCDQFLPNESPLLDVATAYSSSYYSPGSALYGLGSGSILSGTSLYGVSSLGGLSSLGTTTSGTTASGSTTTSGTSTTGTATGSGPVSTSTTTGSSGSTTTSSTSGTATSSTGANQFASSAGSQKLPVSEDLTDKDKKKNETLNEYNKTMVQMAMYSSYCGGVYLKNKDKLVAGYILLGDAYLAQGSYASAQLAYKAALALDENNAKATGGLGLAYIGLGAGSAALSELNLAVAYGPGEPSVYVDRGAYYASIGDPERAMEDYNTALSLDAAYARAYDAIGRLRYNAGLYRDAIANYDKALAIQPYYVAALKHRAAAWTALAAAEPANSAAYTQKAQDDLNEAASLQALVTTAGTATSSTNSWYTPSTTSSSASTTTTTTTTTTLDSGVR